MLFKLEIIGKIVDAFRRLDPERNTFINLFPTYADAEKQLMADDYSDYLDQFVEKVNPHYLSYDNYYFKQTELGRDYFTNAELVRRKGIESGIDQTAILLLTQHGSLANITKSQILYEVNISLAYGFKRISYFTYWVDQALLDQKWSNGCVAEDGTKYQHYYDVTEINRQIYPLGVELADKESVAVFHIPIEGLKLQAECTEYTSYGALGKVDGENYVIGFFDDGSFMIVNNYYSGRDNHLTLLEQKAELEYFDTASAAWMPIDGASFAEKNESGQYVFTFKRSEGILLRPTKG